MLPVNTCTILIIFNFPQKDIHLASGVSIPLLVVWFSKRQICVFPCVCLFYCPWLEAHGRLRPASRVCLFHDSPLMDIGIWCRTWGVAQCWSRYLASSRLWIPPIKQQRSRKEGREAKKYLVLLSAHKTMNIVRYLICRWILILFKARLLRFSSGC